MKQHHYTIIQNALFLTLMVLIGLIALVALVWLVTLVPYFCTCQTETCYCM